MRYIIPISIRLIAQKVKLALMVTALLGVIACDPLATDAVVIQITATPMPRTRPPSPTPPPADTETPIPTIPPTLAPTPTTFLCIETVGQIVDDGFTSRVTGKRVTYRVYLPPCYWSSTRRYPYVILMHGSDADHTQWTNNKLNAHWVLEQGLREGTLPPMLLVMPNGGEIANLNIFTEGRSYEWLILNELMPAVEKTFCTWNSRQGRAIGGISRGGFWAYLIAFRHPELFGAVGGHSAFFSAGNAPPAFNPLDLAKNKSFPANQQPRLWIDAGRNDYARPNIEVFQRSLAARKIDPGYRMFPIGEHNETYWAAHVSDYLEFYGDPWPFAVETLPSCLE
jgi:enterochelin esterase-like enzyme